MQDQDDEQHDEENDKEQNKKEEEVLYPTHIKKPLKFFLRKKKTDFGKHFFPHANIWSGMGLAIPSQWQSRCCMIKKREQKTKTET